MTNSWIVVTVIFVSLWLLSGQDKPGFAPDQLKELERPADSSSKIPPKADDARRNDLLKTLDPDRGAAPAKDQTKELNKSQRITCDDFFRGHTEWLLRLGSVLRTVVSFSQLSETLSDLNSNSAIEGSITLSEPAGNEKEFRLSGSIADLSRQWTKFREEVGMTEGLQATKSSWTRVLFARRLQLEGSVSATRRFQSCLLCGD